MNWIPVLLIVVVIGVSALTLGAVFSEPITVYVRRYFPSVQFDEEGFLLWGLLLSAVFASGLVIAYLFLRQ